MPSIGPLEILAVMVVALVVFGPERLPEIARKTGRLLNELKRMSSDVRSEFEEGLRLDLDDDEEEVEDEPEEEIAALTDEPPADHPVAKAIDADRKVTTDQQDAAGAPVEISNEPTRDAPSHESS